MVNYKECNSLIKVIETGYGDFHDLMGFTIDMTVDNAIIIAP